MVFILQKGKEDEDHGINATQMLLVIWALPVFSSPRWDYMTV